MVGPSLLKKYLFGEHFHTFSHALMIRFPLQNWRHFEDLHPCVIRVQGPFHYIPLQGPIILRVAKMSKHKHHPWALGGGTNHQNPTDVNQCFVKCDISP